MRMMRTLQNIAWGLAVRLAWFAMPAPGRVRIAAEASNDGSRFAFLYVGLPAAVVEAAENAIRIVVSEVGDEDDGEGEEGQAEGD